MDCHVPLLATVSILENSNPRVSFLSDFGSLCQKLWKTALQSDSGKIQVAESLHDGLLLYFMVVLSCGSLSCLDGIKLMLLFLYLITFLVFPLFCPIQFIAQFLSLVDDSTCIVWQLLHCTHSVCH